MDRIDRARRHAALGDERRLLIVDRLASSDRTVSELVDVTGLPGNLLAHHLDILDQAGIIERHTSEGDRRRRYVTLRWKALPVSPRPESAQGRVAFVCTHNSARSQFAAALWQEMTGASATSAGSEPAARVHPKAILAASEYSVDLTGATPSPLEALPTDIDLLITVCDRANEGGLPRSARRRHWSIPDPVLVGTLDAFRTAFADIAGRIERFPAQPSL